MAFHDAIGFSANGTSAGGGADGSILVFDKVELQYVANTGLWMTVYLFKKFIARHPEFSPGDL